MRVEKTLTQTLASQLSFEQSFIETSIIFIPSLAPIAFSLPGGERNEIGTEKYTRKNLTTCQQDVFAIVRNRLVASLTISCNNVVISSRATKLSTSC
jgi:hypothetical protein